jgi:membrane-bound metal-dependent hydrolase YbcI (DUF457 family)
MPNNQSSQTDLKKLIRHRDFFKSLLIAACILWIFILAMAFYLYFKKGDRTLLIPLFALIMVFLPVTLRIRTLEAEIKSRE